MVSTSSGRRGPEQANQVVAKTNVDLERKFTANRKSSGVETRASHLRPFQAHSIRQAQAVDQLLCLRYVHTGCVLTRQKVDLKNTTKFAPNREYTGVLIVGHGNESFKEERRRGRIR